MGLRMSHRLQTDLTQAIIVKIGDNLKNNNPPKFSNQMYSVNRTTVYEK